MIDSDEIDRRVQLLYSQWPHPAPRPVGPLRSEYSADIAAGTAEVVPPLDESTCLNNTSSLSLRCSDLLPDRDPHTAPPRDAIWHLSTVQHNPEVMHTAARLWLHLSSQFEKRYHLCAEELESLRMRHEQELSRVMDVANEMAEGAPSHSMGADISSSSRLGRSEDLTHPSSSSLLPSWLQRSLGDRWTGRRRSANKDAHPSRGHEDVTVSKGDASGVLLSATLTQNVVQRHELELQELMSALREDLVQTEAQLNENFLSFLCVAAPEFLSQSLAVPSSSSRSDLSEAPLSSSPFSSSSLQQQQQLPLKSSAQGPLLVVRIVNPLRGVVTGARPKDPSLAPIIFEVASLETLVMFLSLANAPRMQQQHLLSSAMKQMDGAPTAAAAAPAVVADTPPLGESQQQEELAKTLSAHLGRTASGRHGVLLLVGSRDEANLYLDKAIGLAPELLLQPSVSAPNAPPFSSHSSTQSDSELFSSSSSSALRHSVLRWTPWVTPLSLQPYGTMYGATTTQLHHVQIVLVFEPHSNSASSSLRLTASVAHALCLDVVARALRYNAWNLNVAVLPSLRKQQQQQHPQQPLFATLLLRELRLVLADVQMQDTSLKSPMTWGCNVSSLSQKLAHNSTTAQLSSVQCGAASTSTDPVLTRLTFNLTMAVRVFLDAALRAEGGTLPLSGFGSSSPTGRRTTLSPAAAPRVSGLESLGGALVEEILLSAFDGDVDVIARV